MNSEPPRRDPTQGESRFDTPLVKLLPNLLTLLAVGAGMTAIQLAYQGNFQGALRLIILAALLDGLDGRLARLLRSQSLLGAELDSLADFLNFGVAPALILYAWNLHEIEGLGWIASLHLAMCCLLRLARFNVLSKSEEGPGDSFVGVPSPAGALLALLPIVIALEAGDPAAVAPFVTAAWTIFVGLLMISRLRTLSFKNLKVSRSYVPYVLLVAVLSLAALLLYTWATVIVLAMIYAATLVVAGMRQLGGWRG